MPYFSFNSLLTTFSYTLVYHLIKCHISLSTHHLLPSPILLFTILSNATLQCHSISFIFCQSYPNLTYFISVFPMLSYLYYQSMPGRYWCKCGNSHVCACLHERLLLIIWNSTCDPRLVYPTYRVFRCRSMPNVSFRIKQDEAELWKQRLTVTSVAIVTKKFIFGMCTCTVDSEASTGDFSLVLGTLNVCGHAHVRSHLSPGTSRIALSY